MRHGPRDRAIRLGTLVTPAKFRLVGRTYAMRFWLRNVATTSAMIPAVVSIRYHLSVAMTLRLDDSQTEALRRRAEREGRSMQQVALAAINEYLARVEDDELTDRLAQQGAERFADLLRRLGE
jgi:predicted transcriptional regulator